MFGVQIYFRDVGFAFTPYRRRTQPITRSLATGPKDSTVFSFVNVRSSFDKKKLYTLQTRYTRKWSMWMQGVFRCGNSPTGMQPNLTYDDCTIKSTLCRETFMFLKKRRLQSLSNFYSSRTPLSSSLQMKSLLFRVTQCFLLHVKSSFTKMENGKNNITYIFK